MHLGWFTLIIPFSMNFLAKRVGEWKFEIKTTFLAMKNKETNSLSFQNIRHMNTNHFTKIPFSFKDSNATQENLPSKDIFVFFPN